MKVGVISPDGRLTENAISNETICRIRNSFARFFQSSVGARSDGERFVQRGKLGYRWNASMAKKHRRTR
jgi:hypothetical protein